MVRPMKEFIVGMYVTVHDSCKWIPGKNVKIERYESFSKEHNCYMVVAGKYSLYEADFKEYSGSGIDSNGVVYKAPTEATETKKIIEKVEKKVEIIIEEKKENISIENLLIRRLPLLNTNN